MPICPLIPSSGGDKSESQYPEDQRSEYWVIFVLGLLQNNGLRITHFFDSDILGLVPQIL